MNAVVARADAPCLRQHAMRDSWCLPPSAPTPNAWRGPGAEARTDQPPRTSAFAAIPYERRHDDRPAGLLRRLALGLAYASLAGGVVLVVLDAAPGFLHGSAHSMASAVPLLAIGTAFLAAQIVVRPPPGELAKRVLIAVAFLFWGVNALVSQYAWAALLNDAAVALFVLDLALVMRGHLGHATASASRVPIGDWKEGR